MEWESDSMKDTMQQRCEYKDMKAVRAERRMSFREGILDKDSGIFRQIRDEKSIGNTSSARSNFKCW